MTKRKKPKPKPAPKKASKAKRTPEKKPVEATAASTPIETSLEGEGATTEAAAPAAEPIDADASDTAPEQDDPSDAGAEVDETARAEDETESAEEAAAATASDAEAETPEQAEPSEGTSPDDDQVTTSAPDLPKSSASVETDAEPSDFPPPIPSERVPPPPKQPAGKRRKGKPALPTDDEAETIVWAGTARRDSTTDVAALADDGDEVVSSVGTLREERSAREVPEDLEVTVNLTADLVPMPERDDLSEPTRNRLSDDEDDEPSPESLATTHVLSGDDAEKLDEARAEEESIDDAEAADVDENATDEAATEAGEDAATPSQAATQTKLPLPESVTESHLRGLLEALVFASDSPVRAGELARRSQAPLKEVKRMLGELRTAYQGRGIQLDEVGGAWVFRTNPVYAPFVRELTGQKPIKLTRAQIETLSILAYRQPITRPEIDDIRGVDSGPVLKMLLERDLIKILGKKDEPGRPILYGTTPQFLEFFGIPSLKDLPTLREFTELNEDSKRVVEKELGESYEAISADLAAEAAIEGTEDLGAFDPTVEEPAEDPLGDRRVDEALAEIERATADPSEDETVALADKDLEAPEAVEEVAEALASEDDDEDEDDDDEDDEDEDDDDDDEDDEDEDEDDDEE